MYRIALVLLWSLSAWIGIAAPAWAAEPKRQAPARPVFGTVVAATEDSLTISVKPPPARRPRKGEAPKPEAPPVEHHFSIAKDQTEIVLAEVRRELPFADGTVARIYDSAEPTTAAELKPGVNVDVTSRDGVATRVIIPWGVPGVLVKVADDSVTFRPQPPGGAAGDVPQEQTLKAGGDATKVTLEVATDEVRNERGDLVRRQVRFQRGTLADLQPGQRVVVCERNGSAVKIRAVAPEPKKQQGVN